MNWTANFKIRTRIVTGFAIVLTLAAILAVASYRALDGAAEREARYAHESSQVQAIKAIEIEVANMRRGVRVYGLTGDEKAIKEARPLAASLQKDLRTARDTYSSESRREAMSRAIALADDYIGKIDAVMEARRFQAEAEAKMEQIAQAALETQDKLSGVLKEANDLDHALQIGDIQAISIMARLRSTQYLLHPDEDRLKAAEKANAASQQQLTWFAGKLTDGKAAALVRTGLAQAEQYQRDFAASVEAIGKADVLINGSMVKLAADFADITTALAKDLGDGLVKMTADNKAASDRAELTILALTGTRAASCARSRG
jgi:methyl-accepting chemotaxis protein